MRCVWKARIPLRVLPENVLLKDHSKNKKRKYEWLTPERAAEFYAQPLVYLLIAWIKSGMHETPEEMLEMYQYVASHSMMDLPEDL